MKKQDVLNNINPLILKGIAHRGLHNNIDIPENSMSAFKRAKEEGIAIELDVHLSKDKKLFVFHDDTLDRMTSKSGVIEHLNSDELNDYLLPNKEHIPLFIDVLKEINEEVPIVLELKVVEKNYKELAYYVEEVLSKYIKDKRNILLISFDPRSLWPFKNKGYMRSLLISHTYKRTWLFKHTVESVDLDKELFKYKCVKRYVKRHFVNIWTIDKEEEIDKYLPYVDTMTYQYIDKKIIRDKLNTKEGK